MQKQVGTVKRETLVKDYFEGGLKMISLKPFIKSLKSTLVRRLINNKKKMQEILAFNGIDFDLLENIGVKNIEKNMNVCINLFWKDVLSA